MPAKFEDRAETEERLRLSLLGGFRLQPQLAEQEEILHGPLDREDGKKMRDALIAALKAEPTIGDAERSALQPFGPEQWEAVRTRVQSHLASPTAIPEQDLAVYVPLDAEQVPRSVRPLADQVDEVARLARETLADAPEPEELMREEIEEAIRERRLLKSRLPQEPDELEAVQEPEIGTEAEPEPAAVEPIKLSPAPTLELPIKPRPAPTLEEPIELPPAPTQEESIEPHPAPTPELPIEPHPAPDKPRGEIGPLDFQDITAEELGWDIATALDPSRLTPLPLVAAALEAVGLDEEKYGFLLRYGTFAPVGRKSEIKIAGLGLAEFSHRAADWFTALGASKFPVQVIDEGSGELTVYLLEGGPS